MAALCDIVDNRNPDVIQTEVIPHPCLFPKETLPHSFMIGSSRTAIATQPPRGEGRIESQALYDFRFQSSEIEEIGDLSAARHQKNDRLLRCNAKMTIGLTDLSGF
jgi:hypothetical protein